MTILRSKGAAVEEQMTALKVMLIEDAEQSSQVLERGLREAGYRIEVRIPVQVDWECRVGKERMDIVVVDLEVPRHDIFEKLARMNKEHARPIVVFTKTSNLEAAHEAVRAGVSAYVVDGLSSARIRPIIEVALARFLENQNLRKELDQAKLILAERKRIERAKGIVMQQRGCSEEEAYSSLRKIAMNRNLKLVNVAESVITAQELLS